MADPSAVILRFKGDADDLLERFERARRLWIEAQATDYDHPAFYAACRADDGIVIVTGWDTEAAHQAFGHRMRPHLDAVGLPKPDELERLSIERLGWD
jgi:heme-degrading monooxygenase HmoA